MKFDFQKREQLRFFWSKLSKLHKKDPILHVATTFSLKQGETRTSHGPIPHPLSSAKLNMPILKYCIILQLRDGTLLYLKLSFPLNYVCYYQKLRCMSKSVSLNTEYFVWDPFRWRIRCRSFFPSGLIKSFFCKGKLICFQIIERLYSTVREAFSYEIRHIPLWFNEA